jgi:hypothetical protein
MMILDFIGLGPWIPPDCIPKIVLENEIRGSRGADKSMVNV